MAYLLGFWAHVSPLTSYMYLYIYTYHVCIHFSPGVAQQPKFVSQARVAVLAVVTSRGSSGSPIQLGTLKDTRQLTEFHKGCYSVTVRTSS